MIEVLQNLDYPRGASHKLAPLFCCPRSAPSFRSRRLTKFFFQKWGLDNLCEISCQYCYIV
nr:MAG TPA: hypothetical protein [Caudoviricetes sp.]